MSNKTSFDYDQVYLLKKNKKKEGEYIAWADNGKIIFLRDQMGPGYATFTDVREFDRFYVGDAQIVLHDYYEGIDPETFKKVIKLHGYTLGYEVPFTCKLGKYHSADVSKIPHIQELQSIGLDSRSYVIVGDSALEAYGIPTTSEWVTIVATQEAYDKICEWSSHIENNNLFNNWLYVEIKDVEKIIRTGTNTFADGLDDDKGNYQGCIWVQRPDTAIDSEYIYDTSDSLREAVKEYMETPNEFQLMAYNMTTGAIMVANTIGNRTRFNTIDITLPNVCISIQNRLVTMTGCGSTTLNLVGNMVEDALECINSHANRRDIQWHNKNTPNLWDYEATYRSGSDTKTKYDIEGCAFWIDTIDRIFLCDKEIQKLFAKDNTEMQTLFKHWK